MHHANLVRPGPVDSLPLPVPVPLIQDLVGNRVESAPVGSPVPRPKPPPPDTYYLEWIKGRDVNSFVKAKLSASAEAKRLKQKSKIEDERRALKLFRRMNCSERVSYLERVGRDDVVYRKLCSSGVPLESRDMMEVDLDLPESFFDAEDEVL